MVNFKTLKDKIKNIKISKLFYNNRFVAALSIFLSIIFWIVISSGSTQTSPVTISDVPIDLELSKSAQEDGLRVFTMNNIKAEVDITGNRLVVGRVTNKDIHVTAKEVLRSIISPGSYTLELSASKIGNLQDYEIVSKVRPSIITIVVDRYRETEFEIEPQIDFKAKKDCYVGGIVISQPKIKVSGPESEISKIKKIIVKDKIESELSNTKTFKLPIILLDEYGRKISDKSITASENEVEVSIPILTKKTVEIVPEFTNTPAGINLEKIINISPKTLEIAGPEDIASKTDEIKLKPIDFSDINLESNYFKVAINIPEGCKSLKDIYEAAVEINVSNFSEKTFEVSIFEFKNLQKNKHAKPYINSVPIKIIGPVWKLNLLKNQDFEGIINFKDAKITDSMEMPFTVNIKKFTDVWATGNYKLNLKIT